jgi:hypothetical protein
MESQISYCKLWNTCLPFFALHLLNHQFTYRISLWSLPQEPLLVQVTLHVAECVFTNSNWSVKLRREIDWFITYKNKLFLLNSNPVTLMSGSTSARFQLMYSNSRSVFAHRCDCSITGHCDGNDYKDISQMLLQILWITCRHNFCIYKQSRNTFFF